MKRYLVTTWTKNPANDADVTDTLEVQADSELVAAITVLQQIRAYRHGRSDHAGSSLEFDRVVRVDIREVQA